MVHNVSASPKCYGAYRYLQDRGITDAHIKKYSLQYSADMKCPFCAGTGKHIGDWERFWAEGKTSRQNCVFCGTDELKGDGWNPFGDMIIIPTYENGDLVHFQGRIVNPRYENQSRYMNPKGSRNEIVGFYDLLQEDDSIFITEGPFDAMTLFNYSSTYLMGGHLSEHQIQKLLRKNPKELILVPDHESDSEKEEKNLENIRKNIERIKSVVPPSVKVCIYKWYENYSGKDINEASTTTVEQSLIHFI